MFQPKRILVPRATLSKTGGMADLALEFAGRYEAEVFLLRVDLDSGGGMEDYLWSLTEDESANREAAMSAPDAGEQIERPGMAGVHLERAGNKPAIAAIIDYSIQNRIDLIMMAAHTHSVLGRRVFGGVQLEVIRWAPCPVLTGRRERAAALAETPVRHILVPIDFSDQARTSLKVAKELANQYGSRLSVLHIQEERFIPRLTERGLSRASIPSDPGYQKHAERALKDFAGAKLASGTRIGCHIRSGFIGASVAEFASKNEIDLIVISAKGLTDDPDVELGRAADRIVRKAPCPVLTVRSKM